MTTQRTHHTQIPTFLTNCWLENRGLYQDIIRCSGLTGFQMRDAESPMDPKKGASIHFLPDNSALPKSFKFFEEYMKRVDLQKLGKVYPYTPGLYEGTAASNQPVDPTDTYDRTMRSLGFK